MSISVSGSGEPCERPRTIFLTPHRVSFVLTLVWLSLAGAGGWAVGKYENTPGQAASAPLRWPAGTGLAASAARDTLVMVVHPRCPCSRASLAELAQIMARCRSRVSASVVFVQYAGVSPQWMRSGTWRQAAAIPGVRVLPDPGGMLARRLGARTSGQTYLYDMRGRLLFSGGLTSERGHEGDSAGLRAVLALLRGRSASRSRTLVFGCRLFAPRETARNVSSCRP